MSVTQKARSRNGINATKTGSGSSIGNEDDELCSNISCPAKVNFGTGSTPSSRKQLDGKTNSASGPTKNKAEQVPSKADKGGQVASRNKPSRDKLDKKAVFETDVPSDISCHCFDDDGDFGSSEDDSDDNHTDSGMKGVSGSKGGKGDKDTKDSKKGKPDKDTRDAKGDKGTKEGKEGKDPKVDKTTKGDKERGNDKNAKNGKDAKDNKDGGQKNGCNCCLDLTANFLENSGQVVFPCPTGWQVPIGRCNPCAPCSGVPGCVFFPPTIGCNMPLLCPPPPPPCCRVKMGPIGMCGACQCNSNQDDDDQQGDSDDNEGDNDGVDEEEEEKPKPKKGGGSQGDRSQAKPDKDRQLQSGKGGKQKDKEKGGENNVKVVPCTQQCKKCKPDANK